MKKSVTKESESRKMKKQRGAPRRFKRKRKSIDLNALSKKQRQQYRQDVRGFQG